MIEVLPDFKVLAPKRQRGGSYIQSPQAKMVLFSWAKAVDKDTVQQLFKLVMCRDYLGDVLWAEQAERDIEAYGFNWGPEDPKIDRDKTRLLIQPRPEDFHLFFRNLDLLHHIEEQNKWELTRLVPSQGQHILVEGDIKWACSIPLISLYTFLIKCCGFEYKDMSNWYKELLEYGRYKGKDGDPYNGSAFSETTYIREWHGLPIILQFLDSFADPNLPVSGRTGDDGTAGHYNVHNLSGMGSILTGGAKGAAGTNTYYERAKKILKEAK